MPHVPCTTLAPQVSPNVTRDAVLITGGRGGIGRAVAEALAATGYTAIVTVRKPADVDAIKAGGLLEAVLFDVTDASHTDAAVAAVRALLNAKSLRLVGVVANAGINPEIDCILQLEATTQLTLSLTLLCSSNLTHDPNPNPQSHNRNSSPNPSPNSNPNTPNPNPNPTSPNPDSNPNPSPNPINLKAGAAPGHCRRGRGHGGHGHQRCGRWAHLQGLPTAAAGERRRPAYPHRQLLW